MAAVNDAPARGSLADLQARLAAYEKSLELANEAIAKSKAEVAEARAESQALRDENADLQRRIRGEYV